MATLLETCLALGAGAVEGAIGLFAGLADAYEATYCTTPRAYLVLFAELGLVLAAAWLDPSDPRIDGVIDRLLRDEPKFRDRATNPGRRWLFGLSDGPFLRIGLWLDLATRILKVPRFARLYSAVISLHA